MRKIGDDVVEAVIVDTLESAPKDATHWSTRGLAAKHGISHTTVGEIWRAFGLKPWRTDSFKMSPDPELVEKIRDLVGLHRLGDRHRQGHHRHPGPSHHVILDNLSAHKTPSVHKWLLRHRRFHLHFTPTYGSWMNLVWVNRPWEARLAAAV